MPRVSSEHLAARREQIVAAALACFGRNGFHATTMADVIDECGMSAGAVYRYFRGKDELVEAISEHALGAATEALAELVARDDAADLGETVARVVGTLDEVAASGPVDLRRIALQAWAEALRSPGVLRTATSAQQRLRRQLAQLVVRAAEHGGVPAGTDVEATAQVLQSLVVGRAVQQLLAADVDAAAYAGAVRTLLGHGPSGTAAAAPSPERSPEPGPASGPAPAAEPLVTTTGLGWP